MHPGVQRLMYQVQQTDIKTYLNKTYQVHKAVCWIHQFGFWHCSLDSHLQNMQHAIHFKRRAQTPTLAHFKQLQGSGKSFGRKALSKGSGYSFWSSS